MSFIFFLFCLESYQNYKGLKKPLLNNIRTYHFYHISTYWYCRFKKNYLFKKNPLKNKLIFCVQFHFPLFIFRTICWLLFIFGLIIIKNKIFLFISRRTKHSFIHEHHSRIHKTHIYLSHTRGWCWSICMHTNTLNIL